MKKIKKVIRLMKDELGGKVITIDDGSEDK